MMKFKVTSVAYLFLLSMSSTFPVEWKELYKIDPQDHSKVPFSRYDLDEEDPITGMEFRELITDARKNTNNLIIAQALYTDDQGREVTKTYEALYLLRHLFGPNFISPKEHRANTAQLQFPKKDPISREQHIGSINFFLINNDNTGLYIGSDLQFHSKPNSQQAVKIREFLLSALSEELLDDYLKSAQEEFERAVQSNNFDERNALFRNAAGYYTILEFMLKSLNANDLAFVQFALGNLYLIGQGVEQNTQKSLNYLRAVYDQNINLNAKALADELLGVIYLKGYGVPQNHEKALHNLQAAADQNENLAAKNMAQAAIQEIQLAEAEPAAKKRKIDQ